MFKRFFQDEQQYEIKNLYVGYVGPLNKESNKYICDVNKSRIIIFLASDKKYEPDPQGIDVITQVKYYYFYNYIGLDKLIGSEVIYHYVPLANYLTNEESIKGFIMQTRIIEIWNNLANTKKEERDKEIQDPILRLILETSSKIKKGPLRETDKKYLYNLLSELGKFYISELIKLKQVSEEIKLQTVDPENALKWDVINRLNMIENEINKALITGNLNLDYQKFGRILKKNIE